jgi:putative ABC transport system substrate-binding protein
MMLRRDFITLLGGTAAWPLAARAQQGTSVKRVGVLAGAGSENDPLFQAGIAAFREGLAKLGWIGDRNLGSKFASGAAMPLSSIACYAALRWWIYR